MERHGDHEGEPMERYDVIVVGGRVAGAATAMLLARAGHRVLVLDRARRGSDTLSTHALMRPAVLQLERWGLLEEIVLAGTPPQDSVVFHYGDTAVPIDVSRRLYAPRRTLLDLVLVDAAERRGAEIRFGVDVRTLLRDPDGRVVGVGIRDESGQLTELRARMTVGADGRGSRVAAEVRPEVTHRGRSASAFVYGYWTGVPTDGYEWCFRPGTTGGLIPTDDGKVCVFAGIPQERFRAAFRKDLGSGLERVLRRTSPAVAERVAAGQRVERVRAFPGLHSWLRRPWGHGWALVGDAGYFKDPTTAHGITDALRDAELLALALDRGLTGVRPLAEALSDYEAMRDQLSRPLLEAADAIAGFGWDLDEVQRWHLLMSETMQREVEALDALRGPAEFEAA